MVPDRLKRAPRGFWKDLGVTACLCFRPPKTAHEACKIALRQPQRIPREIQDAFKALQGEPHDDPGSPPRWLPKASDGPRGRAKCAVRRPKRPQEDPKRLQEARKRPQVCPQKTPRGLPGSPRGPQEPSSALSTFSSVSSSPSSHLRKYSSNGFHNGWWNTQPNSLARKWPNVWPHNKRFQMGKGASVVRVGVFDMDGYRL